MIRTVFFIAVWLLTVVFLLFLYGALKLAADADSKMGDLRNEEKNNE